MYPKFFKAIMTLLMLTLFLSSCAQQSEDVIEDKVGPVVLLYDHEIGMTNVPKYINKNGFGYDSAFTVYLTNPNPWLGDFFGTQALQAMSQEKLLEDFVPKYAEKVAADSMSVTLKFKQAGTVKFYPNSNFKFRTMVLPVAHAEFEGETWQDITANIDAFKGILMENGLEEQYLIENPFYELEKETALRMNGDYPRTPVDLGSGDLFKSDNSIHIIPDNVHGDSTRFYSMLEVVSEADFEWLGLEMLADSTQSVMNRYINEPADSEAFKNAKASLEEIYSTAWKVKVDYDKEGNSWMKLFEIAKEKGIQVYGLEPSDTRYLIFRFGETKFGGAVRSFAWAKNIPAKGKGIVFGGGLHFNHPKSINFQDFVSLLYPDYDFTSFLEIKYSE